MVLQDILIVVVDEEKGRESEGKTMRLLCPRITPTDKMKERECNHLLAKQVKKERNPGKKKTKEETLRGGVIRHNQMLGVAQKLSSLFPLIKTNANYSKDHIGQTEMSRSSSVPSCFQGVRHQCCTQRNKKLTVSYVMGVKPHLLLQSFALHAHRLDRSCINNESGPRLDHSK